MARAEYGSRFAAASEIGLGGLSLAAAVGSLIAGGIPAAVVFGVLGGWSVIDGKKRWDTNTKKE